MPNRLELGCANEATALLTINGARTVKDCSDEFPTKRVLPIALLAALAMASTAATAYYAYASILCRDPKNCEDMEISEYAKAVAGATFVANTLGLAALGYLQKLSNTNRKLGLVLWVLCRAMSPVMLLAGGK